LRTALNLNMLQPSSVLNAETAPGRASMIDREARAPVQLPALFVGLAAKRLFLAVADDANPVLRHSGGHQRGLGRLGAVLSQGQVVLVRSAFVAVAAEHDFDVGMRDQVIGILRQRSLSVAADIVSVVIEEDVL